MNRRPVTSVELGADHIYYNIAVQNDGTTPIDLNFQDIRTVEIVPNPEHYYLSVVRFFVPGAGIPLFHLDPVIIKGVTSASSPALFSNGQFTEAMEGLTISGNGIVPGTKITTYFNPNHVNLDTATTITGLIDVTLVNTTDNVVSLVFENIAYSSYVPFLQSSNYDTLSVNSYQQFLDMVNAGYASAYTKLLAGSMDAPSTQYPPKFYWDPQTWLISMYVDSEYSDTAQPQIYMNFNLFSYFQGFKSYQYGYGLPTFLDYKIIVDQDALLIPDVGGNLTHANSYQLPFNIASHGLTGAYYLKVTQDYSSYHVWPSIESIVFTSSLAPIKKEFIPDAGQVGNASQASNNTLPVLSDFVVPTDTSPGAAKGNLEYLPTAEYRLIDFISKVGFSEFNIKAFWQDNHSNLFPVKLEPNDYSSIKFMFRKKSFKGSKSYAE